MSFRSNSSRKCVRMAHPIEIDPFVPEIEKKRNSSFQPGSSVGNFDRKEWEAIYSTRDTSSSSRSFQEKVYNFMDRPKGWKAFGYHLAVFFLVLVCYLLGVLSTDPQFSTWADNALYYPERTVVTIFGVEYLLRLWAAGCRSKYRGFKGRIRYCSRALSLVDLLIVVTSTVFFTVPFDGQMVATSAVRGFRFVQILRMLHVDRQGGTWQLLKSVVYSHRQELLTTVYVGLLGLTVSSYFLYLAEKDRHPDKSFQTYADSLWWSLITMTTIGYGDKVPSTTAGRILAAVCALFTVSFFALPAGILGSGFALKVQQQQKRKRFSRQIPAAATLIQCAWRCYATGRHFSSVACWKLSGPAYQHKNHFSLKNRGSDARTNFSGTNSFPAVDLINCSDKSRFDLPRPLSLEENVWHKPSLQGIFPHSDSAPELRTSSTKVDAPASNHLNNSRTFTTDYEYSINSSYYTTTYREDPEFGAYKQWLLMRGSLTEAQKNVIRAIVKMKYYVAIKKFQEARRPFDVSDVIEQYSQGYINMTTRIKEIQRRLDNTLGRPFYSISKQREPVTVGMQLQLLKEQISGIENKIETMERKLDDFLCLAAHLQQDNQDRKLAQFVVHSNITQDN